MDRRAFLAAITAPLVACAGGVTIPVPIVRLDAASPGGEATALLSGYHSCGGMQVVDVDWWEFEMAMADAINFGTGVLKVDPAISKAQWVKNADVYAGRDRIFHGGRQCGKTLRQKNEIAGLLEDLHEDAITYLKLVRPRTRKLGEIPCQSLK